MRAWKLICALSGRHKWDQSSDDLPESTVFCRINCVRCGLAVDGVAVREAKRKLLASGSPRLISVARRLP